MKGKLIIHGISGNKGQASGKARVIRGDIETVKKEMKKLERGEVLVGEKFLPEHGVDGDMSRASAIIQDTGGWGSHGCVIAREIGIPCVTGTVGIDQEEATMVIKTGQQVIVEGYIDTVEEYRPDGTTRRKDIGAVYQAIGTEPLGTVSKASVTPSPSLPPAGTKFSMADLMKKYGIKPKGD